jgi:hypothetical protein
MSVVREEFGPTLPELLGPRIRALPRAGQVAVAALAVLVVVAAAAALLLRRDSDRFTAVVVRRPIAYNLSHPPVLRQVAPHGRETLRLETAGVESFAVTPFRLPAYRGDSTGALTGMSPNLIATMRRTMPGFVWRGDGRVSINRQPGYEILFQTRIGRRTWYGRRMILVPDIDTPPREGVDIMLMAARSARVPRVDAVASVNTPLKTALRSFRFGTEPL